MLRSLATALLVPTLACAPRTTSRDHSLAELLPGTAVAALHAPAPQVLLSRRATNDYVGLVLDARTLESLRRTLRLMDASPAATVEWATDILSASDELVVYVDLSEPGNPGSADTIVVAAVGGDDVGRSMRAALGEAAHAELADGTAVDLSADGASLAVCDLTGAHVLAWSRDTTDLMAALERLRSARSSGAPSGPFSAEGIDRHRDSEADVLACIDMTPFWDLAVAAAEDPVEAWVARGLGSLRWAHATVSFGDAEDLDLDITLPYAQDTLVDGVLERLREIDRGALRDVPAGARSLDAVSIDLGGLVSWVEDEAAERDPAAHERIEQYFVEARALLGVDVREALVGNVQGTLVRWESASAGSSETAMTPVAATYVARFADAEPLLEAMEAVAGFVGLAARLPEVSTAGHVPEGSDVEYELWSFGGAPGSPTVAIGGHRLVVSTGEDVTAVLDDWSSLDPEHQERFVDDPRVVAALSGADSTRGGLTIEDAGALGAALRNVVRGLQALGLDRDSRVLLTDVAVRIEGMASRADADLGGLFVSTLHVTDDRVTIRGRCR